MIDMNVIELDNMEKYYEVDSLIYNQNKYVLLSNVNDINDITIRKMVTDSFGNLLEYLLEDEFVVVYDMFFKKNKALFD